MAITKLPRSGIADNSINASKIEDGTIAIAEVSGTISNAKLKDGEIANAKLSNSTFTVRGTSRALGVSFSLGVNVDWQSKVTSDGSTVTTMVAQRGYFVDNSSAAGIVKLPASAAIGDTIAIKDYAGNFGTNNLTIQRNGHNIQGVATNITISTNRASLILVYVDSTKGWLFTDEHNVADLQLNQFTQATGGTVTESGNFKIHTFTGDGNFVVSQVGTGTGPSNVDYLVVAGGGGGGGAISSGGAGSASGAGAGGMRTTFPSPSCNAGAFPITVQTYPITVGGGGNSGPGSAVPNIPGNNGSNGSNSIFSTITSAGGGQGRAGPCGSQNGEPGGSGGGASGGSSAPHTGGNGNTPPVSPPQGNNGGTAAFPRYRGAGGGGAGAAGTNQQNDNTSNAPGGAGLANSITGSSVTYAAGGSGPAGGAGTPSGPGSAGSAGTANRGDGGGGARGKGGGPDSNYAGGNGGKGIVVIRYKFQQGNIINI